MVEDRRELRDHAIELIESQLSPRLKEVLFPLLSESSCANWPAREERSFSLSGTADAVISEALVEMDPWMRCCLLAAMREWPQVSRELSDSVQRCANDVTRWSGKQPSGSRRAFDPRGRAYPVRRKMLKTIEKAFAAPGSRFSRFRLSRSPDATR